LQEDLPEELREHIKTLYLKHFLGRSYVARCGHMFYLRHPELKPPSNKDVISKRSILAYLRTLDTPPELDSTTLLSHLREEKATGTLRFKKQFDDEDRLRTVVWFFDTQWEKFASLNDDEKIVMFDNRYVPAFRLSL